MIYALLSDSEYRHYRDLYQGTPLDKLSPEASPAEKRERSIKALESVLFQEKVREVVGNDEVEVMGRGDLTERWRRV